MQHFHPNLGDDCTKIDNLFSNTKEMRINEFISMIQYHVSSTLAIIDNRIYFLDELPSELDGWKFIQLLLNSVGNVELIYRHSTSGKIMKCFKNTSKNNIITDKSSSINHTTITDNIIDIRYIAKKTKIVKMMT